MAQEDSVYLAVFFINPSFVSMGRSSITSLHTSPLATPNLSSVLHNLSHCFSSFRGVHLFHRFSQLTDCKTVTLSLSTLLSLHAYMSHPLSVSPSPSLPVVPPSLSSSLLSIPIQSPANIYLILLSCEADCSETKLYAITCREGEGARNAERGTNELDTDRGEELNSRVAQEPPVTLTDRRRPSQGIYSSSVSILNVIGFKLRVGVCCIPCPCSHYWEFIP